MREYDQKYEAIKAEADECRMQRDDLLSLLANWIVDIQEKGKCFEMWKNSYNDAAFGKNSLVRELVDSEVELIKISRKD